MTTRYGFLAGLLSVALAGPVFAEVSKVEISKLAKAGLDEAVILKYIEANGPVQPLSAQDLIDLKSEGVSDRIIAAAMSQARPAPAALPATPPAAATARPAISAPSAPPASSAGQGSVQLENQDLRDYYVVVDESSKTLYVYEQAGSNRWLLSKRAPLQITLAEGSYKMQWVGEQHFVSFNVREGGATQVKVVPVSGSTFRALTVRVTEDGQEKSSGALKVFEQAPAVTSNEAQPASTYQGQTSYPTYQQPVTNTVIVPETRYVYLNPSPVYVGVSHVHYLGCGCPGYGYDYYPSCHTRYYSPGYYSSNYYPGLSLSYSRVHYSSRGRTGFGVSVGF